MAKRYIKHCHNTIRENTISVQTNVRVILEEKSLLKPENVKYVKIPFMLVKNQARDFVARHVRMNGKSYKSVH